MTSEVAILTDERDLVWLLVGDIRDRGDHFSFDVHFLSRDRPDEAPEPFLSGLGYQEPAAGLRSLLDHLAGVVLGEIRAMRHDPVSDGLSIELKVDGDGPDRDCEVVLWLDLTRTTRAMKVWGSKGRQRAGLRFHTGIDQLESFRVALERIAFPAAEA